MSAPGGPPERTGRILARWQTGDVPYTRPPKPVPIDLDAWARYEAANRKANREYEDRPIATTVKTTCHCGRRTEADSGVCERCQRKDRP